MERRTRTKEVSAAGGNWYFANPPTITEGTSVVALSATMMDYHKKNVRITQDVLNGTLPPSDMDSTIITRQPYTITRLPSSGWWAQGAFRGTTVSTPGFGSPLLLPARGNFARVAQNEKLMLELLARTNPVRPVFSVPVAIRELVDIGTMFHLAAKTFAGFLGGLTLNYKFGWLQFFNDVKTLARISLDIEKRMRELQSLQQHGGLRRRLLLFTDSNSWTYKGAVTQSTFGVTSKADVVSRSKIKIYGSVRWTCSKDFKEDLKTLGTLNKAFRLVLDLEAIDAETMWNLIPFSWLADYFTNIGTWLGANAGVELFPNDICIVREFECLETYTPIPHSNPNTVYNGKGRYKRSYVGRDVVYNNAGKFPTVTTELLSFNQWQNITALAAAFKR